LVLFEGAVFTEALDNAHIGKGVFQTS